MRTLHLDPLLTAATACGMAFLLAIGACVGLIVQDSLSEAVSTSAVFVGPAVGCILYAVMLLRDMSQPTARTST